MVNVDDDVKNVNEEIISQDEYDNINLDGVY